MTEIDLQIEFKRETGIDAYNDINHKGNDKKKPREYTEWIVKRLLKFENDKIKVAELFTI